MNLPNGHLAIVDLAKLRDYCLSQTHYRGRHQASVFLSTLGLKNSDAAELRDLLLIAAETGEAQAGESDENGTRYAVDFENFRTGKRALIRSCWIIGTNDGIPRLTSAYVVLKKP